MIIHFC